MKRTISVHKGGLLLLLGWTDGLQNFELLSAVFPKLDCLRRPSYEECQVSSKLCDWQTPMLRNQKMLRVVLAIHLMFIELDYLQLLPSVTSERMLAVDFSKIVLGFDGDFAVDAKLRSFNCRGRKRFSYCQAPCCASCQE